MQYENNFFTAIENAREQEGLKRTRHTHPPSLSPLLIAAQHIGYTMSKGVGVDGCVWGEGLPFLDNCFLQLIMTLLFKVWNHACSIVNAYRSVLGFVTNENLMAHNK